MRKPLLLLLLCAVSFTAVIRRLPIEQEDNDEHMMNDAETQAEIDQYVSEFGVNQVPELPKMSKTEKWDMIRATGQDPTSRRIRQRVTRRSGNKSKRDLFLQPWRITHVIKKPTQKPLAGPAVALDIDECPRKFDAVTRGYNGRTYVFARERVYQMWHEDGLQQKASYLINELFPGGPRSVTAALTNSRSGVTILIDHRTVYRFRWNRKHKRFQLAKNTPQEIPRNVTITPQAAFEWKDGNQVLMAGEHFVLYDAYWNLATFTGHTRKYFPNLPRDLLGVVYNGGNTVLILTKSNTIKVYNTKKFRVVQEYPLKINDYVGCLAT